MRPTVLTLIAATVITATAAPAIAREGAQDRITAEYHAKRGEYCVRSGWGKASWETRRLVRAGECRTASDWRTRGLKFEKTAATRLADSNFRAAQTAAR